MGPGQAMNPKQRSTCGAERSVGPSPLQGQAGLVCLSTAAAVGHWAGGNYKEEEGLPEVDNRPSG